ncbi:MAG: hypothetical protein BECKG1743D_GA0114223_105511, partial [Candidatus Kentron sp. G]
GSEVKGSWTPYFGFFSPINLKPNKSLDFLCTLFMQPFP